MSLVSIDSNILPFLQGLIADGTIPHLRYAISADNGNCGSGDVKIITDSNFSTECIQTNLIDIPLTEGASLRLTSLYRKFEFTFMDGKWVLTRNWTRPIYNINNFNI
jgi:hypothetical protein